MIKDWKDNWFIIANEGADPIIVDLEPGADGIQKFKHGAGSWDYRDTLADTIGQFLLCSAAQHYVINNFGDDVLLTMKTDLIFLLMPQNGIFRR